MPAARPVFNLLLNEKNPAADDALVTALTCASPAAAHLAVQTILARHQGGGFYGLVEQLHHLDDASRQLVVDSGEKVFRALREAFNSKNDQVRLNVLEVIRQARLYRAAYLLEAGLHDRQPRVRELAAEALHTLADAIVIAAARPVSMDISTQTIEEQRVLMADLESRREDRRQLASALATGLACFNSHLQPKVAEAAMWLVDDLGIRFWTSVTTPSSRALRAAITILEQSSHPRLVPFAMEALAHSELRPHVLRMLASRCDPEFMCEWLRQGWRLAEPRLARAMIAIKELACLQDRAAALLQLPDDSERHLARWLRLTGLPSESRAHIVKELYRRGGSELRRSAIWSLTETIDEKAVSVLRAVAGEKDTDCSHIARLELSRRFPNQYPPGEPLPASSIPAGHHPARSAEAPWTLERYWNEFDILDPAERMRVGSLVVARTKRSWAVVNRQLASPEPANRIRALKIITTLGISAGFADQLYTLSYDPQPDVRSAAILALGQVPNATSKRILQRALIDPDDRVQANAVEAGDSSGHLGAESLLPMLASSDNRVRANAVKALLKLGVREAAETLILMLADPDRRQRASALWLVDKLGLFGLTHQIVRMATADRDPQIRSRASTIRDRLLSEAATQEPVHAGVPL